MTVALSSSTILIRTQLKFFEIITLVLGISIINSGLLWSENCHQDIEILILSYYLNISADFGNWENLTVSTVTFIHVRNV